jgi:hypothetical protein
LSDTKPLLGFDVLGVSLPQLAASKEAAPRSKMPCAAIDGSEWRLYPSDLGLDEKYLSPFT